MLDRFVRTPLRNERGFSDYLGKLFLHHATCGSMNSQAQELDADGYAAYLVLTHLPWREAIERAGGIASVRLAGH
jgi:hypothetical protein